MVKKILLGLVIVLAIFAVVVAVQPSDFRIQRTATIAVPPAEVFAQVNSFRNWEAWSPWVKLDPNAKTAFEGPAEGTGTIFTWSGNGEVGEGKMTITESHPNDLIKIKLDFNKPFVATNLTEFTFKPEGEKTVATWTMTGQKNFVSKAFCLFMNMDKMVGDKFDEGFAAIKKIVEPANKG